jgi:hypothetical protein
MPGTPNTTTVRDRLLRRWQGWLDGHPRWARLAGRPGDDNPPYDSFIDGWDDTQPSGPAPLLVPTSPPRRP